MASVFSSSELSAAVAASEASRVHYSGSYLFPLFSKRFDGGEVLSPDVVSKFGLLARSDVRQFLRLSFLEHCFAVRNSSENFLSGVYVSLSTFVLNPLELDMPDKDYPFPVSVAYFPHDSTGAEDSPVFSVSWLYQKPEV